MKRVLTAAVLVPPVIWVIFPAPYAAFWCTVCLIAILCYREFAHIADAYGYEADGALAYGAGLVLLWLPRPDPVVLVMLAMGAMALALRSGSLTVALPQAAAVVFGVLYVFGGWRCALLLREMSPHWLFFALGINWLGDVAAYYAGSKFGRHKMAPRVSPGKSWEGGVSSLIVSTIFGAAYLHRYLPSVPLIEAIGLSVAANIAGQFGDLCESAMKRGAGVKDSGNLLPGHGGWLDRVDSTLFTMPVVFFWLTRAR
jgi:phosphatidate cytidylyltransferase